MKEAAFHRRCEFEYLISRKKFLELLNGLVPNNVESRGGAHLWNQASMES